MTLKEIQNLPNDTIIYDEWGTEFIKIDSGLKNTHTDEILNWITVDDLYGSPNWEERNLSNE